MSWFKRKSPDSPGPGRLDTDPNTCLEVFQNHWKQACAVISGQDKKAIVNGHATVDGVETVLHNLEQMVTLLVGEDDDGGLPGPILRYVMQSELLENFCAWCHVNVPVHDRLRLQQLRLFELVISQSHQLLLVHKPIIKPLLRLLIEVADSPEVSNGELEFKLVLVLHQICICISQQNLILESFFSTDTDHGPARFLIFSLLIPYIHREGPVGQKARDALLLIMTLSARHPHIGQYIANNSDFCPVLATGLSALYSSLPRRIAPPTDDWFAITREDCVRIPDLQMFLNSLQFSNAVVQIAHPLVRDQLIEFIYTGFLVPVLAPALHQDIPGLPIPLLDTDLFRISREEVMTATAYLDLFIRHVTDPHLLKATLRFVLVEKHDDVLILDTLLSRIGSNSHLSTVSLALFHTLVNLNCEDVMFQLVFRFLVPCTHVMVSQRRSVRDLDLYGKSAEKFLSLRPSCCLGAQASNSASSPSPSLAPHIVGMSTASTPRTSAQTASTGPSVSNSGVAETSREHLEETSYFEYLHEARNKLEQSAHACHQWSYVYDGENPPPDFLLTQRTKSEDKKEAEEEDEIMPGFIAKGSILKKSDADTPVKSLTNDSRVTFDLKPKDTSMDDSVFSSPEKCNNSQVGELPKEVDPALYASLADLSSFVTYLSELEDAGEGEQSLDETAASLSALMTSVSHNIQRCSSTKDGKGMESSTDSVDLASLSPIPGNTTQFSFISLSEIPAKELSNLDSPSAGKSTFVELSASEAVLGQAQEKTAFEEVSMSEAPPADPVVTMQRKQVDPEASSYIDISLVPEAVSSVVVTPSGEICVPASLPLQLGAVAGSTPVTTTTKKERNVPNTLPRSLEPGMNPLYMMSVVSPQRSSADLPTFHKFLTSPGEELPAMTPTSPGPKRQLKYSSDPPNIGPFLSVLFSRLEGMISNTLYFNLLLTDVISRLASYPQPLLRSFLLNHNLVFQPSVKSLIQVLSSLRQKLESFSVTVKQFDSLVSNARQNLFQREEQLYHSYEQGTVGNPATILVPQNLERLRADTVAVQPTREKKKATLGEILFRRSPGRDKLPGSKRGKSSSQLQPVEVPGGTGYRYINNIQGWDTGGNNHVGGHSVSTWNAVYCALVLDEFLKELAALSQEHSVLHLDEGYLSS